MNNQEKQNPGAFYSAFWKEAMAAVDAWRQSRQRLSNLEAKAFGFTDTWQGVIPSALGEEIDCREVAMAITRQLCARAAEMWTPPGQDALVVDSARYSELFVRRAAESDTHVTFSAERFDPQEVWDALVSDFSGDKAAEAVYRTAANAIETYFGVRSDLTLAGRRNGAVLSKRVWLDSIFARPDHKPLAYAETDDLRRTLLAMRSFVAWAGGDANLAEGLEQAAHRFSSREYGVCSRERIRISDRLVITTFLSKFEWWIERGLAKQLQVFLQLYGDRKRQLEEVA